MCLQTIYDHFAHAFQMFRDIVSTQLYNLIQSRTLTGQGSHFLDWNVIILLYVDVL